MVGGYFHILVFLDVFKRFFKAEYNRGNDAGFVIGAGSTHVGELLRFGDVHDDVVFLGVLADNLAGIDFFLREDEEAAAVLKL